MNWNRHYSQQLIIMQAINMEFVHYTEYLLAKSGPTKVFRVRCNRMQFKCPKCGARRNFAIPQNLRRKNIQCHKCKQNTKCILDKRIHRRVSQSGKIDLILDNGQEIAANIIDISPTGIGVKIPLNAKKTQTLKIGERVTFRCSWNSRLLGHGRYVVKNINARQIGFEKNR